ncbi:GNAT family N-acetyltransferase [Micrococcales bacterium 31B]|nr:GNAT family N-acetyltransferase [Micrococcales bacterium 31B]
MLAQWPVVLDEGDVRLRPFRRRDRGTWERLRALNADWLRPWEPTPPHPNVLPDSYLGKLRALNRQARRGSTFAFAVEYQGNLVGQVTFANIVYGSVQGAVVGYWVSQHVAGRGVIPTAVAMGVDYCLLELGLHRIEANIRPENLPSRRVVEKLGFRPEGVRERFLHIDGEWRDHLSFALTREDAPGGVLQLVRKREQRHVP